MTWTAAWARFTLFLAFPPMLRRVIYTANSIESLNYQGRRHSVRVLPTWPANIATSRVILLRACMPMPDTRAEGVHPKMLAVIREHAHSNSRRRLSQESLAMQHQLRVPAKQGRDHERDARRIPWRLKHG